MTAQLITLLALIIVPMLVVAAGGRIADAREERALKTQPRRTRLFPDMG